MKTLLRTTLFPAAYAAALGLGLMAIDQGWSLPVLVPIIAVTLLVLVTLLERVIPRYPEWNQSHSDVKTDLLHNLFSMVLTPEVVKIALTPVLLVGGAWLSSALGSALWPASWPLWAQLPLAFVLVEFLQYWVHRLAHERDWLWRFHAVHHSAERLYAFNAGRDHPLGAALFFLPEFLPLVLLGAPQEILALQAITTIVCGLFQHANLDIRLGPLRYVFSIGELHRWHHQRDVVDANHNYGSNWILWDLVFGTYYLPDRAPSAQTGIGDMPHFPQTWWAQMKSLFQWKQLKAQSASPEEPNPS